MVGAAPLSRTEGEFPGKEQTGKHSRNPPRQAEIQISLERVWLTRDGGQEPAHWGGSEIFWEAACWSTGELADGCAAQGFPYTNGRVAAHW